MTPKQLNPWLVEPLWQNFSSLYREAITAQDAKTGMERSHHLTASLYFGIAALEAFLNKQMRDRLKAYNSEEEEILNILRKPSVLSKIKKWPQEILGRPMPLREETLTILCDFNEIRGDLTHPKTSRISTQQTSSVLSQNISLIFTKSKALDIPIGYLAGTI
jgi:hypothetical protein